MKNFHCSHCQQVVYFENVQCVFCGNALAFLPDIREMASMVTIEDGTWISPISSRQRKAYRLCPNYTEQNVCNWAIEAEDPHEYCISCRLNEGGPDFALAEKRVTWAKIETAKRRMLYTLLDLGLPVSSKTDDPENGMSFRFLADGKEKVFTGHMSGVITLNIAEADDSEREKRRHALGELYRTLLGHFRHEIGHFYWDRLIANSDRLEEFRKLFGDERADYGAALKAHYAHGAPAGWQLNFISTYATMHPWEDWAETWAHYLHMIDTVQMAAASGLMLRPRRKDEPTLKRTPKVSAFEEIVQYWFPLTHLLNNLNRGLGLCDGYPFIVSETAIAKLKFVHDSIAEHSSRNSSTFDDMNKLAA